MENTIENKTKFFAQHYGQKIFIWPENENGIVQKVGRTYLTAYGVKNRAVQLKSISSISNDDALKIAKMFDLEEDQILNTDLPEWIEALFEEAAGYYIDGYRGDQLLEAIDFLRSEGYALSWMGLTVKKQIEYGWVVLID